MLAVHKFIDALSTGDFLCVDTPEMSANEIVSMLRRSVKFDFGYLPLEKLAEPGVYKSPHISDDEMSFWNEQLIPLPYSPCWFEFVIGESRSGLLVLDTGDGWTMIRLDMGINDKCISYDGLTVSLAFHSSDVAIKGTGEWLEFGRGRKLVESAAGSMFLAIYLTLMLNSRTTEVRDELPPIKLNKRRVKRGKEPLSPHRVVTLVPRRFRYETVDGVITDRLSPRLHWRRSHKRHFDHAVPSAKWSEKTEHNGRTGWYVSVVPRCLVGRSDLGEISHDYFVPIEKEMQT